MKKHNPVPAEKKIDCPGKGCGRVGKHGFDRKDHMKEHLVNHHHRDIREVKGKDDPTPTRRSGRDGERY